jgi:hypothetical protein
VAKKDQDQVFEILEFTVTGAANSSKMTGGWAFWPAAGVRFMLIWVHDTFSSRPPNDR